MPDGLERVRIDEVKITEYLLSESHPDGKSKAAFFLQCGFSVAQWNDMAEALREHAAQNAITITVASTYGTKYVVEGRITTPNQRHPFIRSVWIQEPDDDMPRLVTAYPIGGQT